jgi:trehalose 6-phosphate synthase
MVCVSNRVTLPRRSSAAGGLAVGVLQVLKRSGGMWFGWGGEIADGEAGEPDIHIKGGVSFVTLELTRSAFEGYYNGYANDVLWPLFHYFVKDFHFNHAHHDCYQTVNRTFAQQLAPLLRDDDVVWVHDYHLIPMARHLRELGVRRPIGFFLHIPFPHIEVLRILPTYAELLRDLLAYDVVGFHTETDLQAFCSGVEHLFGRDVLRGDGRIVIGDHVVHADIYPIGVDVAGIRESAAEAVGTEVVKRMVDSLVGRKLMIGVDRLDYSKGLVERFDSYQQFLETYPDNLGRISYIQIAPLSRSDVRAYAEIRQALEQSAGHTNGRFADTDWTPIRYLNRNFPHATMMGFLRSANVGLVTPLRDGMNLVAKEFVAAQDETDPGVLILSTLAGAARELTAALLVNPYDTHAVSRAMQTALSMPLPERRERHQAMLAVLERNDIATWTRRFVAALEARVQA